MSRFPPVLVSPPPDACTADYRKALENEGIDGFYNLHRRHSALNYNSPIEFELMHPVKRAA